jgi:hypothetical protein
MVKDEFAYEKYKIDAPRREREEEAAAAENIAHNDKIADSVEQAMVCAPPDTNKAEEADKVMIGTFEDASISLHGEYPSEDASADDESLLSDEDEEQNEYDKIAQAANEDLEEELPCKMPGFKPAPKKEESAPQLAPRLPSSPRSSPKKEKSPPEEKSQPMSSPPAEKSTSGKKADDEDESGDGETTPSEETTSMGGPGEHKNPSEETKVIELKPGEVGIGVTNSGLITNLRSNDQVSQHGVTPGCRIVEVEGQRFSLEGIKKLLGGNKPYKVTIVKEHHI